MSRNPAKFYILNLPKTKMFKNQPRRKVDTPFAAEMDIDEPGNDFTLKEGRKTLISQAFQFNYNQNLGETS